ETYAGMQYRQIHGGKLFKNGKVYQFFESHVSGYNSEEVDHTQPQESESEVPSEDASSSVTGRSDPRRNEPDDPRQPSG
ncbi:hypothetical protein MKX01_022257, partial [Papaver californicum]